MKRTTQTVHYVEMEEKELDVLINRAFFAGVCAQRRFVFLPGEGDSAAAPSERYIRVRDEERANLKDAHFKKG